MNFKYKITLFTPTYNRAYVLETLYRSIQRQTFRDFEWIVVDDGSTDNTEDLVNSWMEEKISFLFVIISRQMGGNAGLLTGGWIWQRENCFLLWIQMII